ncbi:MAG: DNA polymerase III subunit delta' [Clostridia bacterium]|nr:DNA polymerase III subunit delta' [Clostridia bacterium]
MPAFKDFEGQSAHIARLHREFSARAFSHAYLFAGPEGTGKRSVARLLAMAALCERGMDGPCGECGPCRRVLADTHPDVHTVQPEKGKRDITVGVMRSVLDEVNVHSFEDGAKIFLIPDADKMNSQAQNSLLKTLEEPPENTVFILSTARPAALLPTVRSRLRLVRFHALETAAAAKRLEELGFPAERAAAAARLSQGCVGKGLQMDEGMLERRRQLSAALFGVHGVEDIPAVTDAYKDEKLDRAQLLSDVEDIVRDVMAAQAGALKLEETVYPDGARDYAARVPLSGGVKLMGAVQTAQQMLTSHVSFQGVLETILLEIAEEYGQWPW